MKILAKESLALQLHLSYGADSDRPAPLPAGGKAQTNEDYVQAEEGSLHKASTRAVGGKSKHFCILGLSVLGD